MYGPLLILLFLFGCRQDDQRPATSGRLSAQSGELPPVRVSRAGSPTAAEKDILVRLTLICMKIRPVRQTIASQCCFRRTNYRPQTKFAKVMFLHLSVNRGGMHGRGVACMARGACMAGGGMHCRGACMVGGCAWLGGVNGRGACVAGGCAL